MGKIYCLIGKSGSGKDTAFGELMNQNIPDLERVVTYTTRPIREGEKDGVQYHFTDNDGFEKLLGEGKVIEHRTYDTFYGEWKYFTVADENIDLSRNDYLIIIVGGKPNPRPCKVCSMEKELMGGAVPYPYGQRGLG